MNTQNIKNEYFNRLEMLFYMTWFGFVVRYRKTIIGPLWLLIGPALFILMLGVLFARVNSVMAEVFIPHLTIGLVVWTLINNLVTNSTSVFQRARIQILQGGLSLGNIVAIDILTSFLTFMHQVIIILVVLLIYPPVVSPYMLVSLLGLALILVNGYWLMYFFGIIGVRYRDLYEIVLALMRIAFLATPIIWMPSEDGRGGLIGHYITFNPFYHFLELVRAPLLGKHIDLLSWIVVLTITLIGFTFMRLLRNRYARYIPLWV